jgi:pyrroloquinoline quinone (PQQ) biosynthesis protein C
VPEFDWTISARPLLCGSVTFSCEDHELLLESPDNSYSFTGASAQILSSVLPQLIGEKDVEVLGNELEIEPRVILAHLNPLAADGLILNLADTASELTSEKFIAAYMRECRFRTRQIFIQPFWDTLLGATAPATLLLGWGIEFYHYVESANEHMAASVAHCRHDPQLRRWLAEHYAEEYNHGEIFLKGLTSCGLDQRQVKSALPLPSTRALINYLTELASSDTLAYAATFGVMQAEGENTTRSKIDQLYDELIASYPSEAGLFEAVRKHALIDVDLNHQELILERLCNRKAQVDPVDAQRIVTAVVDTVEHFILFFEGIYDYYLKPGVIIPRRGLDIRTLLSV